MSQYEEKDRLLLRNLCFVLGAKFNEKLNKKITHLLCKVKDGQKYHAACNWGIEITTADWLFACVSKVSLDYLLMVCNLAVLFDACAAVYIAAVVKVLC